MDRLAWMAVHRPKRFIAAVIRQHHQLSLPVYHRQLEFCLHYAKLPFFAKVITIAVASRGLACRHGWPGSSNSIPNYSCHAIITRKLSRLTIAFQFVIAFIGFGIAMISITWSSTLVPIRCLTILPCLIFLVNPTCLKKLKGLWLDPGTPPAYRQTLHNPFCSDQSTP